MDNIITPTATFDFSTLNLENPLPLQGGSFFTKLNFSDKSLPLYVQLPRAESKHGIVRNASTKKAYIDLLFGFFENDLQTWFENLEIRCRELIFEKKDLWFQTEMTADDIENSFISPSKSYRSGKFVTVRTHLPMSRQLKHDSCMIYDESERQLDASIITATTKFIPLIHVEGIRFSSKSFQVEINVRQIMVLSLEDTIKKSCMIKYGKTGTEEPNTLESLDPEDLKNPVPLEITEQNLSENDKEVELTEAKTTTDTSVEKEENSSGMKMAEPNTEAENQENPGDKVQVVDLPQGNTQDNELHEVDLAVGGDNESISLKNPKDVYMEIYKAAYEKAKHMKQVAIEAHLEAQNIKSKYMLDDILASDDELSNYSEIEE